MIGFQIVVTFNPQSGTLGIAAPQGMPFPVIINTLQAAITQCLVTQITAEVTTAVKDGQRIVPPDDLTPEQRDRLGL